MIIVTIRIINMYLSIRYNLIDTFSMPRDEIWLLNNFSLIMYLKMTPLEQELKLGYVAGEAGLGSLGLVCPWPSFDHGMNRFIIMQTTVSWH